MYRTAESELKNDFMAEISYKFKFITLAIDDERDNSGVNGKINSPA
jgi:hypothetical protein